MSFSVLCRCCRADAFSAPQPQASSEWSENGSGRLRALIFVCKRFVVLMDSIRDRSSGMRFLGEGKIVQNKPDAL